VQEYEKISGRRFKINGYRYTLSHVHKTGNKYFKCVCAYIIGDKCPGFIIITPNNQIVKKVDHTCSGTYTVDKPSENNGLEEVQEYEGNGNNFKINRHTYHFTTEPKTGNKCFRCIYTNTKKCPGSFVITPNCGIAKKVEHTCIGIDAEEKPLEDNELEEVQEYEKTGGNRFKINGHDYRFCKVLKTKNKHFRCVHRYSTKKRCQGSITITPNLQIVKKVEHICNDFGTEDKPLEDKDLEKVQEYEEIGENFKINGHRYYLTYKHKTGNKYFAKKVEHACTDIDTMEEEHEHEEISSRKFKINGYIYYCCKTEKKTGNKYFRCIFSSKKCRAFVTITPNLQIVKKVDHNCEQVCEITCN
jgi:hypothetical protein